MSTYYLDYENGSNAGTGADWANAWKTITSGATAARIAPGDVIRIAKSPDPVSLGTTGVWTNLSNTVTLGAAQNATIDLCESAWTRNGTGDITVALTGVATDGKEGSYCMKLTFDAAPQTSKMQAYFATGTLDLSGHQKISFWLKNSGAVTAGTARIALCSDTAGATPVDYFDIPAIPSTNQWVPLTLTKSGGGNLGASIKSIALYTDSAVTGLASKYFYVDDFIACTTNGLNLQSLISKNSLAQAGDEGWYGIQSINGVTILLDNSTNTKGNAGKGYSGTTETVTTYKRETIKTDLGASSSTEIQAVQDSGTLGNNIEFQGGYNTSTSAQDGETFFDGLNGNGYGLTLSSKSYVTFNYLNVCRYGTGIYFSSSNNNTITTLSNANNNGNGIYFSSSNKNTITTLINVNNNYTSGINYTGSNNNTIITLSNINNHTSYGIYFSSSNKNTIITLSMSSNNNTGVYFLSSDDNIIKSLSTSENTAGGVQTTNGTNYLFNALIAEGTEVAGNTPFANARIHSFNHEQTVNNHWIFTDGGKINSLANDRVGGAGLKWKYALLSTTRVSSNYPLDMVLMEIPVNADSEVTVTAYCMKDHASNVGAKLVCRGGQLAGVASDVADTKADDTDWEQLSISFTPTESGVIEIEGWGYYVSGYSNVYFADVSVSQA